MFEIKCNVYYVYREWDKYLKYQNTKFQITEWSKQTEMDWESGWL